MAIPFNKDPYELELALNYLNYFFISVFFVEACLKIFSLSFIRYIINPWNKFDFCVLLASFSEVLLNNISAGGQLAFLKSFA